MTNNSVDVVIVGGGLAGLASAIHLSKLGVPTLVIEKHTYPRHKVCGEYLSYEVVPYLNFLGIDLVALGAKKINRLLISTAKSKAIETQLPLGGYSISRHTLDYTLSEKVKANGGTIFHDTVLSIEFIQNSFKIKTKGNIEYQAKVVIGAFGKRSNLDASLDRFFLKKKSPLLAVKTYLKGDFPDDLVALHNFNGGYCGVSKVETNHMNVCYMTDFKSFQKFNNFNDFQQNVLCQNDYLKTIFENSEPVLSKPLTISQISFSSKNSVENHIMMCGDSAGMIHPLSGNGMSMAIHSAQMVSTLIEEYLLEKINSRSALEQMYVTMRRKAFKKRLIAGRYIAPFFGMNIFSELLMAGLQSFPKILPKIIEQTHGKLELPENPK
ncbi:NAD(P)/FAD-dependent oxidoreductase [Arenibacter sp. GZD96]|uniref:NAD(P)/FAD-dependent oxidoreductase n=1 Tax=Aurantibrevibacter litoralis TaxID=3106030 RepID=UPI002AFFB794|nr:NAD(P)/FAD-dependent oxidoreductase [Arenibacter sp. GZD-96]MEA1786395.1 NAD(P)/FAD-dependent oxidoreductase [Arenibacter sp. GZD-96]